MPKPTPKISPEAVEAIVIRRMRAPEGGDLDRSRIEADLRAAYPAIRSSVLEELREELKPELNNLRGEARLCREQAQGHGHGPSRNALLGRATTFEAFAKRLEAALSSLASEGGGA